MQGAQGHSSAWREVPGACAFIWRGRFVSFDSLLKIAEKFSVLCSWDTGQLCVPLALGLPQLCPVTLHGGHLPSSVDFGTIPPSAACLPLPQFQGQLTYIFITLLRFKHCSNSCPTANLPPPVPMCDPNPAWWQDPEPGSSSGIHSKTPVPFACLMSSLTFVSRMILRVLQPAFHSQCLLCVPITQWWH